MLAQGVSNEATGRIKKSIDKSTKSSNFPYAKKKTLGHFIPKSFLITETIYFYQPSFCTKLGLVSISLRGIGMKYIFSWNT